MDGEPEAPPLGDVGLFDLLAAFQEVLARAPTLEEAARVLGVDASTLWRKRKKYGA